MGMTGTAPLILNLTLRWRQVSASCPGCFTPGERASGNHWQEGCMGPTTSLEAMDNRNISCPCQDL